MLPAAGPHAPAAGNRSRRHRLLVATLTLALGVRMQAAYPRPGRAAGVAATQAQTVSVVDFGFSPAAVQVQMGPAEPGFLQPHAHVGFVNSGPSQHTVTFDNGPRSPTLDPNQFFDAVLTVAGSFPYHCTIHPGMQGTVTVTPLPTTTTTTTEPPPTVPPPTAAASTSATAAPTATTARPRTTVATATPRPATGAVPPTTTAASPPAAADPITVATTVPPVTTATTDGDGDRRVAARRTEPAADSPRWSVFLLILVLLGGGGAFFGRRIWLRHRAPSG